MSNIQIIEENERGNIVQVGEIILSWLRPPPNGVDVYTGPEGTKAEDIVYIRGYATDKYCDDTRSLFPSKEIFDGFIAKQMPGKKGEKMKRFSKIMGCKKSGYLHAVEGFDSIYRNGYVWITCDKQRGCELFVSEGYAESAMSNTRLGKPTIVFTSKQQYETLQTLGKQNTETEDTM